MKFMTPEEQVKLISNIGFVQEIKKLPFVEKVMLFGSRARGASGKFSDIDIAVVCPQADIFEWNKILDIVENAETLLPIDCVRFDTAVSDLQENIKKEGIVL